MEPSGHERRRELAQFLRTRRARLQPEQAGLVSGGRRRTPGLRRAEVALLAGVSADWYTWLEQARNIQVSAQVLDSLAAALRLNGDERKHLYLLALQQLPAEQPPASVGIGPVLQRFLELQGTSPAYVMDPKLNVVGWNKAAALIYGDYASMSERERNSLWRTFTSPYVRQMLQQHWESHARYRLATFRSHYANDPGNSWWTSMIDELNAISPEFQAWWPQHDVLSGPEGKKINHHPLAGRLVFDQLSFVVSDAPHLTMTINVPDNNTDTASRVERLLLGKSQPGER